MSPPLQTCLLASSAGPPGARSPFIADLTLQIFPNQSRFHPQKTEFQPPQANTEFSNMEGLHRNTLPSLCMKLNEEINELFPLHRHSTQASGAVPGGQDTSPSLFSPLRWRASGFPCCSDPPVYLSLLHGATLTNPARVSLIKSRGFNAVMNFKARGDPCIHMAKKPAPP